MKSNWDNVAICNQFITLVMFNHYRAVRVMELAKNMVTSSESEHCAGFVKTASSKLTVYGWNAVADIRLFIVYPGHASVSVFGDISYRKNSIGTLLPE